MSQTCPHCMTEIADNATTCPGCHAKYRSNFDMQPWTKKALGFSIIAAILSWGAMYDYGLSLGTVLSALGFTASTFWLFKFGNTKVWWN